MSAPPLVLTIGALHGRAEDGILADAAVIAELDGACACVATALVTAPGTPPEPLSRRHLLQQLSAALEDVPRATRIGFLPSARDAEEVASRLRARAPERVVLAPELPDEGRAALLPLAAVIVVRAAEDRDLDSARRTAARLRDEGARAVLVTGATLPGRIVDYLDEGGRITAFDTSRLIAARIPGISGSHATALTAHLARGESLTGAAEAAQRYVALRLRRGR